MYKKIVTGHSPLTFYIKQSNLFIYSFFFLPMITLGYYHYRYYIKQMNKDLNNKHKNKFNKTFYTFLLNFST